MRHIRAFVAIELDDALKIALGQIQARLKRTANPRVARWVAPEAIHLTLKFLGDVPADRIDEITGAVRRSCEAFAPFSICLSDAGCFPNPGRPRVIWVGVDGELKVLMRLQHSVESELSRIGLPPEKRGFHAHLTLARLRRNASSRERVEIGEAVSTVEVGASVTMTVREVSLMRSDLRPTGAVYTRLASVSLSGEQIQAEGVDK